MPARRKTDIRFDPLKLLRAFTLRGVSAADVAASAGISATTLSGVVHHGRPVSAATARRIAAWLHANPPLEGLAEVLKDEAA